MWYLPAIDASVVIMWNRWPHDTARVTDRLAEPLVDRARPGRHTAEHARRASPSGAARSPRHVRRGGDMAVGDEGQGQVVRYERASLAGGPWEDVRLASRTARDVACPWPGSDRCAAGASHQRRGNGARGRIGPRCRGSSTSPTPPFDARRLAIPLGTRLARWTRAVERHTRAAASRCGFRAHAVALVAPRARVDDPCRRSHR